MVKNTISSRAVPVRAIRSLVPHPLALAVATLLATPGAWAQATNEPQGATLQEVTISASGLALGSSEMTTPVTVLEGDALVLRKPGVMFPIGDTLVAGVGAKLKGAGVTVVKAEAKVTGRVGGGYVVDVRDVPESAEAFAALMDQVLVDATRISRRFVRPPRLVGAPRGVYVAATRGDLLFLNTTGNQVDAEYEAYAPGGIVRRGSISLPPQAMRSVAYPR